MPEFALEIEGLAKSYGGRPALDGLSFGVRAGQMFGFVGPNRAGETTAMRAVVGVLTPDAGEVRWHGRPFDAAGQRRIGYMPEERGLYPKMAACEQVTYFARLHGLPEARARAAATEWLEPSGSATVSRRRSRSSPWAISSASGSRSPSRTIRSS